jgi:hypothetical protein
LPPPVIRIRRNRRLLEQADDPADLVGPQLLNKLLDGRDVVNDPAGRKSRRFGLALP